jgi:hypothetical protein
VRAFINMTPQPAAPSRRVGGDGAIPVWLKLARHGSSVTGSVSPATAWTEIGTTVV